MNRKDFAPLFSCRVPLKGKNVKRIFSSPPIGGIFNRNNSIPFCNGIYLKKTFCPTHKDIFKRKSLLQRDANYFLLTLLHSERPKLNTILAFLSAVGLSVSY